LTPCNKCNGFVVWLPALQVAGGIHTLDSDCAQLASSFAQTWRSSARRSSVEEPHRGSVATTSLPRRRQWRMLCERG